jgi:hypothetical protein
MPLNSAVCAGGLELNCFFELEFIDSTDRWEEAKWAYCLHLLQFMMAPVTDPHFIKFGLLFIAFRLALISDAAT